MGLGDYDVPVCECGDKSPAHKMTHEQFKQKAHELVVDDSLKVITPNEAVCKIIEMINEVRWK